MTRDPCRKVSAAYTSSTHDLRVNPTRKFKRVVWPASSPYTATAAIPAASPLIPTDWHMHIVGQSVAPRPVGLPSARHRSSTFPTCAPSWLPAPHPLHLRPSPALARPM